MSVNPFQSPRALLSYRPALIDGFDYMRRPFVLVSNIADHRRMLLDRRKFGIFCILISNKGSRLELLLAEIQHYAAVSRVIRTHSLATCVAVRTTCSHAGS